MQMSPVTVMSKRPQPFEGGAGEPVEVLAPASVNQFETPQYVHSVLVIHHVEMYSCGTRYQSM